MGSDIRPGNGPLAWMVRGGQQGEREARALREGLVFVGWHELGNLTAYQTRQQLSEAIHLAFPATSRNVVSNWTGQLWRFATTMREGDLVVMPLRSQPGRIAIGKIAGAYEYRGHEPKDFQQVRKVDWIATDVSVEAIRPDLRASLGSLLTVCGLSRNDAARRINHLANNGTDPGFDGQEEVTGSDELLEDAASRDPGSPRRLTILNLLEHWGERRRTSPVIATIKTALADKGLTTRPPFTEGSVSDEIALIPLGSEPGSAAGEAEGPARTQDLSEVGDMSLRLGNLPAPLVSVPMTADLTYVKTLMLRRQFSQVAVIDENGTFHGAVSWESIGKAHIASTAPALKDAIQSAMVVDHDALLLDLIEVIYSAGFIFVRDADRARVTGIVTAADLSSRSGALARPFVLIEEAENRLRRVADEVFTVEELRAAMPPGRQRDDVHQAKDLSFGAYRFLLREPHRWAKLGWNIDHQLFLELLDEVRVIRNALMHFAPDPLGKEEQAVSGLLNILRAVDPRP
ncbi:CBS domain-containing protein [Sinosporangium siamense]|uniref:CBS domain-containing protein n=1 Tax=Sinosporangium siamense TaxID=1367973 RepID=UPI001950FCCF|nr:CBS domain-containing protein [Sinosporangium siamense]